MQKYRLAQCKFFSLNIYCFRQITPQNKIYIYIYIKIMSIKKSVTIKTFFELFIVCARLLHFPLLT